MAMVDVKGVGSVEVGANLSKGYTKVSDSCEPHCLIMSLLRVSLVSTYMYILDTLWVVQIRHIIYFFLILTAA